MIQLLPMHLYVLESNIWITILLSIVFKLESYLMPPTAMSVAWTTIPSMAVYCQLPKNLQIGMLSKAAHNCRSTTNFASSQTHNNGHVGL